MRQIRRDYQRKCPSRSVEYGFTLVELMVTVAVFAIILGIAVPNFSQQVQQSKADSASDAFVRAVHSARARASQTGLRTVVLVNPAATDSFDAKAIDNGCGAARWAVLQSTAAGTWDALSCMNNTDFRSRYGSAEMTVARDCAAPCSLSFQPTGIGMNSQVINVNFKSGSKEIQVAIEPGGVASAKNI